MITKSHFCRNWNARALLPAVALALTLAPATLPQALAQGDEMMEEIVTVGIGSRRPERSITDSSVPVDVLTGDDLENIGFTDMNELLRNAVPSYNVSRFSIADAATIVRPANLRGLPPDNTLILVNGKRRHRSGVIAELGGDLSEGSQGPDISAIPALAIRKLEVLRDGAAAQYGSDAIAGVINYELKNDPDGFTFEARTGRFSEGDGDLLHFSGNVGLPLGDDGFINITASWSEQDPTNRSTQRTDAATLIRTGNADQKASIAQPYAQVYGGPEYRDNWNLFFNSGIQVSDTMEVYAFGNYGQRETEGGFFYRNPNNRSGVYTNSVDIKEDSAGNPLGTLGMMAVVDPDDPTMMIMVPAQAEYSGTFRAIVDTNIAPGQTGVMSNCPALLSPGSGGNGNDLNAAAVAADAMALANLPANCRVLNQVVPGGYTPQFGASLKDASIVGGIRGQFNDQFGYDFSASYGRNAVSFFIKNTWNPSNGPNDGLQRDFSLGTNVQSETNLNADFVYMVPVGGMASDISIAFGFEWRDERFETIIGEEASWETGPYGRHNVAGDNYYAPLTVDVEVDDPDAGDGSTMTVMKDVLIPLPNLSIGAHGFAGFSPPQAGLWSRSNYAVYGEVEVDFTEAFTGGVAVRFEDFETFGTTTNFKLAGRYRISEAFALRGSYNTGFRAPTPGQENVTKVSTTTVDGVLQQSGQIPPTNPVAQFLGGEALTPEESTNFSVGLVWDATPDLNITLDYFQIQLEDRLSLTGNINITTQPVPAGIACPLERAKGTAGNLSRCLQEIGVPGAADLTSIKFYTNDFETTTRGIDVVASYDLEWGGAGEGTLTAAWNWTKTEVDDAGTEVDRNKVLNLEHQNPHHRAVFTYAHFINDFRFLVRARYYDDWVDGDWSGDPTDRGAKGTAYNLDCTVTMAVQNDQCYDGEILFDVEAAYTFNDSYTFILGANNAFDQDAPIDDDHADGTINNGNTYDTSTPWGYEGAFYYARFRVEL